MGVTSSTMFNIVLNVTSSVTFNVASSFQVSKVEYFSLFFSFFEKNLQLINGTLAEPDINQLWAPGDESLPTYLVEALNKIQRSKLHLTNLCKSLHSILF